MFEVRNFLLDTQRGLGSKTVMSKIIEKSLVIQGS